VTRTPDGAVFEVAVPAPLVVIESITGFSPRESNDAWTWRWMGRDASWTIVNVSGRPQAVSLDVELEAFAAPRVLQLRLDGADAGTLTVGTARGRYTAPLTVPTGAHTLTFHPVEPPVVADTLSHNGDQRPLSFAIGDWRWTIRPEQP